MTEPAAPPGPYRGHAAERAFGIILLAASAWLTTWLGVPPALAYALVVGLTVMAAHLWTRLPGPAKPETEGDPK